MKGLYCPCSEIKGTNKLRGYSAADLDLHLFFAYAKSMFSHDAAHMIMKTWEIQKASVFVQG